MKPCVFSSCRHNLAIDSISSHSGEITWLAPLVDGEPALEQMVHTCSLDLADEGDERPLESVAEILQVSRQAIEQCISKISVRKQHLFADAHAASSNDALCSPRPRKLLKLEKTQRMCVDCREAPVTGGGNTRRCDACIAIAGRPRLLWCRDQKCNVNVAAPNTFCATCRAERRASALEMHRQRMSKMAIAKALSVSTSFVLDVIRADERARADE